MISNVLRGIVNGVASLIPRDDSTLYKGTAPSLPSSAQSVLSERDWNSEEAQKSRDWQKEFAQNSYQWAVDDLKKAGINPILAYQSGAGTTSAPTASYSGEAMYRSSKETAGATKYSADSSFKGVKYSANLGFLSSALSTFTRGYTSVLNTLLK